MADESLVEGWTEPVDSTLFADGSAFDGTGVTLALVLRDRNGSLVNTSGKATWRTAANGTVRFSPAAGDLKAANSPYEARWKVTASGKDAFFPNDRADIWTVRQ